MGYLRIFILLVQTIQIKNSNLAEKITCLHGGQDLAGLAQYFQDAIGYYEHLSGHFAFATYRVAWSEYVRFHFKY